MASIYIMRRRRRSLWAVLTLQWEYKIGIAHRPQRRVQEVSADVPGGVVLVRSYRVRNARKIEKRLHVLFDRSRYTMRKAGARAGKTEWFYLSLLEVLALEAALVFMARQWLFWLLLLGGIIYFC